MQKLNVSWSTDWMLHEPHWWYDTKVKRLFPYCFPTKQIKGTCLNLGIYRLFLDHDIIFFFFFDNIEKN